MNKSEISEIIEAIEDALDDYNVDVNYYHPSEDQCGFFELTIDDEYEISDITSSLAWVLSEYELKLDFESNEDFDLIADWDTEKNVEDENDDDDDDDDNDSFSSIFTVDLEIGDIHIHI